MTYWTGGSTTPKTDKSRLSTTVLHPIDQLLAFLIRNRLGVFVQDIADIRLYISTATKLNFLSSSAMISETCMFVTLIPPTENGHLISSTPLPVPSVTLPSPEAPRKDCVVHISSTYFSKFESSIISLTRELAESPATNTSPNKELLPSLKIICDIFSSKGSIKDNSHDIH
ncbi:hypothetical protein KUTeg_018512, partial [Tegillarca granosa]